MLARDTVITAIKVRIAAAMILDASPEAIARASIPTAHTHTSSAAPARTAEGGKSSELRSADTLALPQ
jgi:hypothetical protein